MDNHHFHGDGTGAALSSSTMQGDNPSYPKPEHGSVAAYPPPVEGHVPVPKLVTPTEVVRG